jgi:hypothetical protein
MPLSIVNAVAVQPTDSNVILAGGAGNCNSSGVLTGAGVFRSADRGLTWTRVLSTNVEDLVFVPGTSTSRVPSGGSVVITFGVNGATLIDAAPQACTIDGNDCAV